MLTTATVYQNIDHRHSVSLHNGVERVRGQLTIGAEGSSDDF